ncbi:glycosyltransferase family 2 protein [Wenxinia saemankumensis]|uniref:Succinoglycan biosynthesis protein ExoO n=1 Tax=Wenxinia saemankumensis TaxID=1447782 RepID=A0A1M5ZYF3_9RHOB|nr:glycosyltransferase [Wenxinia saemankumensis]SHI29307.1 succinoglycan biosynthesis protein ExoO [Wenxinia saemankumensis]
MTPKKPTDPPDVTIVIPVWRAADSVAAAVASALGQVGVTVEVLVVDDASEDGTADVLRDLARQDARIRMAGLDANGGPAAARNHGLDLARGTWIAMLDADDTMTPPRLHRMIGLGQRTGADIVLGNVADLHPGDDPAEARPFLRDLAAPERWTAERFLAGNRRAAGERSLGYLKPVLRRGFVERTGLRYDPSLRNGEDCHLILEAFAAGAAVWYAPAADYLYRRRPGSLSHRSDPAHLAALLRAEAAVAPRLGGGTRMRRLLRSRRASIRNVMIAETAIAALKAGRPAEAAAAILLHPAGAPRLAIQLAEATLKRATGRRSPLPPDGALRTGGRE